MANIGIRFRKDVFSELCMITYKEIDCFFCYDWFDYIYSLYFVIFIIFTVEVVKIYIRWVSVSADAQSFSLGKEKVVSCHLQILYLNCQSFRFEKDLNPCVNSILYVLLKAICAQIKKYFLPFWCYREQLCLCVRKKGDFLVLWK